MACGATLSSTSSKKGPAGSNICWNCGEGKQPVIGNCSKCGMNLAGEEILKSRNNAQSNGKFWAIGAGAALVALVAWGFTTNISNQSNSATQQQDVTDSSQYTSAPSDLADGSAPADASDSPSVTNLFNFLDSNGNAGWSIDSYRDMVSGAEGVILADQCSIWVYPDLDTKTQAIDSGFFDDTSYLFFWWDDDPNWPEVVLTTEDEVSTCAMDAEDALGWNLEDFVE